MKTVSGLLFILAFPTQSFAEVVNKRVYDVQLPAMNEVIIRLYDGSVIFSDNPNHANILKKGESYRFDIDAKGTMEASSIPILISNEENNQPQSDDEFEDFDPTVVSSDWEARNIFNNMQNRVANGSQCFHKAHFWAHQLDLQGVKTGKAFLFFTQEYIRQYNFNWWFHVAPTVKTYQGKVLIMDRYFFSNPVDQNTWTNNWIESGATCDEIQHYDQYERRQYNAHCYIRHVPQYYYHPDDVANLDRHGITHTNWKESYLRTSYHQVGYLFPEPAVPDPVPLPQPRPTPVTPVSPGCECAQLSDGSCGIWEIGKNEVLETGYFSSCSTLECKTNFSPRVVQDLCSNKVIGL